MTESQTLQSLVRTLAVHDNRLAIQAFHRHTVESWSYHDLAETAGRLQAGLLRAGLRRNDPVVLYAPNRVEWILGCLALLDAGAIPVPIDSQLPRDDLAHVLADSGASWIMTTGTLAERLKMLGLDEGRTLIVLDAGEEDPRSWRCYLDQRPLPAPTVSPEDPAVIFYTSGVSGRPKGVPLSHSNLLANLQSLLEARVYHSDERLLLPLPFHHVYPFMVGVLAPLAQGLPVIFPYSLTGPQILRALRDGRATAMVGVPRIYAAFYAAIERRVEQRSRRLSRIFRAVLACSGASLRWWGLPWGRRVFAPLRKQFAPHLRTLVYGGAPLAPDLAWKLAGLGWQIAGGFGLTETSPILTLVAPGSRDLDTAGTPLPGVRLRVADPDPETGQGEIQALGQNVFRGYLHLPDKTAEAFTSDGWFRTGDLGYFDPKGCLRLVGRASSRITLPGGEKIWPERVEEALEGAPSVKETGVFAREGRLVGIVVPRMAPVPAGETAGLTSSIGSDIAARLNLLPSYCRLTDFVLSFDPLPRTRLGKIQRHKLKALFDACRQGANQGIGSAHPIPFDLMAPDDRQLLEDPVALRVWNWLTGRFSSVRLTPDTHLLLDLGLDSLEWMTLTVELRDDLGLDLDEDAIARIGSVRDLLRESFEARDAAGLSRDPSVQLGAPDQLLDREQQNWLAERGPWLRGFRRALFGLIRALIRKGFDLEVRGIEHIPAQGPWVLTPNHASFLDAPVIIAALPEIDWPRTYWGGWTGIMFRNSLMRLFSRAAGVLPIDQTGRPLATLALGAAALARGNNLIWFPEGHRSRDGRLQPFQTGIGWIVMAHPVPVIPVRIEGTFDALPRNAWWPRRGPITIFFGEAVYPDELAAARKGPERYRQIAATLHDRVATLPGLSGSAIGESR